MTVRQNSSYSWVPISSESMAYPTFNLVQYSLSLGAHFDQMLTMVSFINYKIKVASYHLRRIGSIRKYITAGICHKLVVALVTSNIDYCNGLLGGLAAKDMDRLQRLQNRAARLVTRWKAIIHHHHPSIIHPDYQNTRQSTSSKTGVPWTHSCTKVVGKQAFGTRAPELWNKLPLNIRTIRTLQSFKQTLKTHLFQSAYGLLWWPTFLALFLIRYWNF